MKKRRRGNSGLLWTLPVIGFALAVVVALAVFRPKVPAPKPQAVPAAVLAGLTKIPAATWDRVGAAKATPPTLVATAPAPQLPTVLYVGAEYCPFCAAERWPLIAALARFGTFTGLDYTTSSATDVYPNTPTFTFLHATYGSPYVKLQTVELQGNVAGANGQYPALQKMTPAQQAAVAKYDAPPYVSASNSGAIPFVLVGGRYLWSGASYSPGLLAGQRWPAIAGALPSGSGAAATAILTNANEIAAAVCAADGGRPQSVCASAGVAAAARTLPKTPVK